MNCILLTAFVGYYIDCHEHVHWCGSRYLC